MVRKRLFRKQGRILGVGAEELIAEFRQLNSVFALSLRPHPPHPDTRRKLLQAIRKSIHPTPEIDGESFNAGHMGAEEFVD